MSTAITLEALQAGYGDCLLLTCPVPGGTWRMLIDTGPDETWPRLRERLAALPPDAAGRRHIDLLIVSHIDHDHIGASRLLLADKELGLSFGDVWFNGRHHLVVSRSPAEGESLATVLGSAQRKLPWNEAFGGKAVCTPDDGGFVAIAAKPGHPQLTLLSPTPKRLAKLAAVWDREMERLRKRESNSDDKLTRGKSEFPDLEALAAHDSTPDASAPNGSSIALLLEHRGASVLLAADAFSTVLGRALMALAQHRGTALPMQLDAFKLSHHGSRANLVPALLSVVNARRYVISTDNTRFAHPDDEALACVVLNGGLTPTLAFNHATQRNLRWGDAGLQKRYGFEAQFAQGTAGLKLVLPRGKQNGR